MLHVCLVIRIARLYGYCAPKTYLLDLARLIVKAHQLATPNPSDIGI